MKHLIAVSPDRNGQLQQRQKRRQVLMAERGIDTDLPVLGRDRLWPLVRPNGTFEIETQAPITFRGATAWVRALPVDVQPILIEQGAPPSLTRLSLDGIAVTYPAAQLRRFAGTGMITEPRIIELQLDEDAVYRFVSAASNLLRAKRDAVDTRDVRIDLASEQWRSVHWMREEDLCQIDHRQLTWVMQADAFHQMVRGLGEVASMLDPVKPVFATLLTAQTAR